MDKELTIRERVANYLNVKLDQADGGSVEVILSGEEAFYIISLLSKPPEEQALSLLRQLVNLTEHFDDAVWYDKDNVRHPAVTPLVHTLAAEVRQYLDERQPQQQLPSACPECGVSRGEICKMMDDHGRCAWRLKQSDAAGER